MKLAGQKFNRRRILATATAVIAAPSRCASARSAAQQGNAWDQWGGPSRDFRFHMTKGLQSNNQTSPLTLAWERLLGKGHAGVVSAGADVITVHLEDDAEVVTCRILDDGRERWLTRNPIGYHASYAAYDGPHATPCIAKSTVLAVSIDARVRAFDRPTGKTKWSRDLRSSFGTQLPQSGYAASPIVDGDRVILPTLGIAQSSETEYYEDATAPRRNREDKTIPGAVALDLQTGQTIWRTESFRSSHASPIIAEIDGQSNLIFHGMFELIGVNPATGAIRWRHLLRRSASDNVSLTPLWDARRGRVLISHGYCDKGAQAIEVHRRGTKWETKLAWTNRKLRMVHSNAILAGATMVGVNDTGAALAVGVDLRDGRTLFRQRHESSNLLYGDENHVVSLDHTGRITLERISQQGLSKNWTQQILDSKSWTVPSVIKNHLLVRDDSSVKVFRFAG
ncbi:MAG: PQQ-binding-like beta-propeller repeat protein [Planctomycetota bacterium]